mmetsp:Transcript_24902/g.48986  ORF Transcript_24902/g.48986 Transcript_24902/m.48986 type:complete len:300 (+) Transcript_24902:30-929(+)
MADAPNGSKENAVGPADEKAAELPTANSTPAANAVPTANSNPAADETKTESKEIDVPIRYINAEKGDVEKGRARYLDTLRWRKENRIDEILEMPHPNYHTIMSMTEAYYMGIAAKSGSVVYFERPKSVKLAELATKNIKLNEMLFHFVWMTEYCWKKIDPSENGRIFTVLDLEGVGVTDLVGEVLEFVKASAKICRLHYPERSYKIFLINCSRTFTFCWTIVKQFLDPVTLTKINLSRTDWKKTLYDEITTDQALKKYGGTSPIESHLSSDIQKEIAAYVDSVNANPTKPPLEQPLTQE